MLSQYWKISQSRCNGGDQEENENFRSVSGKLARLTVIYYENELMFYRVYRLEVDELCAKIKAGTAKDCFAVQLLAAPETAKLGETQMLFALGSIMEAGSDTSRMIISQILAAAATDGRWVKKAQALLDEVCGSNAERLPEFSDRPKLKYITAAVKESFRWRPIAEIGVPHMLTKDDEYEGYKFPAGTLFTWNSFNIALDPTEYDEPERFWPERFMNKDVNKCCQRSLGLWTG
jgi:cytochrome P450